MLRDGKIDFWLFPQTREESTESSISTAVGHEKGSSNWVSEISSSSLHPSFEIYRNFNNVLISNSSAHFPSDAMSFFTCSHIRSYVFDRCANFCIVMWITKGRKNKLSTHSESTTNDMMWKGILLNFLCALLRRWKLIRW